MKAAMTAALVATVIAANWTLERYGVLDVGPLLVPAGTLWAGLAFGLRDVLHEIGGRRWVLAAIVVGAGVSWWVSDGVTIPGGHLSIAVASGVTFLFSELVDMAVYTPLRDRHWSRAVIASNLAGAVVDSTLFLWLAFGAVDGALWWGQTLGKALMILPALPLVWQARGLLARRTPPALAG